MISLTGSKKMGAMLARTNQKDLVTIAELLESGKIVSVIDRCYALRETAKAIGYYGEGHARGKVVVMAKEDERASH